MGLDLVRLEQFVAVAQERTIRGSAETLGITQPTVSRGITSLERRFGCQLLIRHQDGVELTPAGWLFLGHAVGILQRVERAEKEMLNASQKRVRGARKLTPQERRTIVREAGKIGGKLSLYTMTPKERTTRAKKAAAKSAEVRTAKAEKKRAAAKKKPSAPKD